MANSNIITREQLKIEDRALAVWQLRAIRRGLIRSCINCDSWIRETEGCRIANGLRPPAAVIVIGCDAWEEEIPF